MSNKCTITLRDEVNCNIRGLDSKHRDALYDIWSIKVHNAHFMPMVKTGKWDGKVNFIKKTGNTYINLLTYMVPWILERDYEIEVIDQRTEHPSAPSAIDADIFSEYEINLRWYQTEAVNVALENSAGLLILATAAGKSIINAAIVSAYDPLRSITIVPNTDLVTQTAKTFAKVGLNVGVFYGKKKEADAQHIISTWQSLNNHRDILKDIGVIIVDEVHNAKSTILHSILTEGHGAKIPFRFGLTGTLPKAKSDQVTLNASIGVPIYTLKAKQLMDEGFLSRLHIYIKQIHDTPEQLKHKPKFTKGDTEAQERAWGNEKRFLSTNKHHNVNVANIIQQVLNAAPEKNTLILIDSIDAGKALSKILNCKFIYGDTDTDDRTLEYDDFEGVDGKTLIATFGIAKAGIDITRLHNVFLIDAGKAFTKIIQSVGRGLRTNSEKNFVNIYDICSNSYYSNKHLTERTKYYTDECYPFSIDIIYPDLI